MLGFRLRAQGSYAYVLQVHSQYSVSNVRLRAQGSYVYVLRVPQYSVCNAPSRQVHKVQWSNIPNRAHRVILDAELDSGYKSQKNMLLPLAPWS